MPLLAVLSGEALQERREETASSDPNRAASIIGVPPFSVSGCKETLECIAADDDDDDLLFYIVKMLTMVTHFMIDGDNHVSPGLDCTRLAQLGPSPPHTDCAGQPLLLEEHHVS